MWNLPISPACDYTVTCKCCGENIPAPVQTMPDTWIVAECPLCTGAAPICLPTSSVGGFADMGEMRRAIGREEEERRKQDRFGSTLVIAAAIIAAVRLARDDISRPSPRVQSVIADSVQMARSILNMIVR